MYVGLEKDQALRVSHSSLSTFDSCPRKYEFKKLHNHSGYSESVAAGAGTALHEGYQEYLRTTLLGMDHASVLAENPRDAGHFAMMQHYPFHLNSNPEDDRSIEACYATLEELIKSTATENYELAQIECLDGVTRAAIEVPFEIHIKGMEIAGFPIYYTGFMDTILLHRMTREFVVQDIKTHRAKQADLTGKYMHHGQVIPYSIILETLLGHDMSSLEVSYLSTLVDIVNPKVIEYKFIKSREAIEDWVKELYVKLANIKQFVEAEWFPRNGNGCFSFFRNCEFLDMCESRNHAFIQQMLSAREEPTNPRVNPEPWVIVNLDLGDI